MDVAEAAKSRDDAWSDSDSTAVSSALSELGESPASARGAPATPAATTTSESVSAEFTLGSQRPTGVGGKQARRVLSRPRESVRQLEPTPTRPESRVGSLVWAVPYLSDGIMRRARRWAWVLQGPADLPPSDGDTMGFQAGLPAKRLHIPKVSGRARAQGRVPVRGVEGSLGSARYHFLCPEGFYLGLLGCVVAPIHITRTSIGQGGSPVGWARAWYSG